MAFMVERFAYSFNFSQKKHAKPSASDASEPGGIGFLSGSLVRESNNLNNFLWSP